MKIELILLAVAAIVNVIMGLIVLLRGRQHTSNRFFGISAFTVALWSIGDILILTATDPAMLSVGQGLFYVAPLFTALYLFFFSRTFPANKQIPFLVRAAYFTLATLLGLTIIFDKGFLVKEITHLSSGVNLIEVNPFGFLVYTIFFAAAFGLAYRSLYVNIRKYTGAQRNQIRYSFVGILVSSSLAFMTNLSMPLFITSEYIWLGPLFTAFYVITTTIAIIKHRLFDIRLVIARSLAYIFLLITLAALYGIAGFTLSSFLFQSSPISGTEQTLYIVLAVILSLTFQPLKRFFDKTTNRILYHDAYDTQEILDRVGGVLVSAIAVKKLAQDSLPILQRALRSEFIVIVLSTGEHFMQDSSFRTTSEESRFNKILSKLATRSVKSVIVQDEIQDQGSPLYQSLVSANVAVIVKLETSKERLGYVLFGQKVSGNIYSSQDVHMISIATGTLAVAIQNGLRFEEISNFNDTLKAKVEDATAQLRQTNKKLHVLDEAKDDFISMASHQLRTPLTSVKGYLSMVLEGDIGTITATQRKVLEEAYTSSQRMVYLIGDFLNVSRIQTGKFELERSSTNLATILSEEIDQLRSMAQGRELKIEYTAPSHFPVAYIDQDKFRQVMMNFIDNAIYYSHSNDSITILLTKEVNDLVFKVIDQGIGVPADERHKLFTKFYRASNAKKQRPDGTGIGLFMAQKVIVAHGGSVIFESKENQGSTFGFRLPLKDNLK